MSELSNSEKMKSAAEILFNRKAPENYLEEWRSMISMKASQPTEETRCSVVIFRIGSEWLALSTTICKEIYQLKPTHSIPYQEEKIVKGLVNIAGQILMCVSLSGLLGINSKEKLESRVSTLIYPRMFVIEKEGAIWVFRVEEVYGIYACEIDHLTNVPVTLSKSTKNYLKGIFAWQGMPVGLLDEELIFYSLKRSIQ